jgi:hypothetical protein
MPVDFGILAQTPSIGARYMEGLQMRQADAERNMLRQAQMQQMAAQQENMAAQRAERLAMAADREEQSRARRATAARQAEADEYLSKVSALFEQNNTPLNLKTAQQGLAFAVKSRDPSAIQMMTKTVQALQEKEDYAAEATRLGLPGAAPAPAATPSIMRQPAAAAPAAPTNMLAGTPFDIGVGAPAPANALVAPPAAAPAGVTREMAQQMILSTNPRIREQGKALVGTLPKEDTKTPTQKDYERAVEQGFKGTLMEYKQAIQPKPAQLSVKLPEQEKAFESELGKGQAKKAIEDKAVAEDAKSIITTVQEGRRLLQSGVITGFGADFLTSAGAALNQAGINFAEDAVANTQAFTANMAANVGRIIKQFGAGTGLSNADREYAEKMAGGKVTLDRKAIERILDINERAARNVIALHNKNVSGIKTNVPLTVDVPSRLSAQDQQALDWANSNPRDPRAAQIKQRLGAQ